jgi:predicted PurR-regulated permease PerM
MTIFKIIILLFIFIILTIYIIGIILALFQHIKEQLKNQNRKVMTHTEKYNQYVQEWIKENPAFSGSYESMLDFDQWFDKELEKYKISIDLGSYNETKEQFNKMCKEKGL